MVTLKDYQFHFTNLHLLRIDHSLKKKPLSDKHPTINMFMHKIL